MTVSKVKITIFHKLKSQKIIRHISPALMIHVSLDKKNIFASVRQNIVFQTEFWIFVLLSLKCSLYISLVGDKCNVLLNAERMIRVKNYKVDILDFSSW